MSDPLSRNRLSDAASPYLRQHADNPVNWQPWDDEARSAAREHDRPIFLSVGYAACHWCHVMEEESFDDESVAETLNEGFVPVKVDREERPDLDRIYQTICQLVTGRGGWPLSVWLTPDGRPFHVGTYFPPTPRHGHPAFPAILDGLRDAWENDREEIESRADEWTAAIRDQVEGTPSGPPTPIDRSHSFEDEPATPSLVETADAIVGTADREHGGFGTSGPKFPQPTRLDLLLSAAEHASDENQYSAVVRESLDAMADRGLYDHLGGGFHRYATDREWTVPHFEKMLYDNGELPRIYVDGYRAFGRERYAEVVHETAEFLDRELSHPDGGFYSTLDARSRVPAHRHGADGPGPREEGEFFVWTPEEVRNAVADDLDAELFCARYGVTERGNFEGKSVLRIREPISTLAEQHGLDEREVRDRLDRAREATFEVREGRPRPPRDEKVLAGWNGLVISALSEAGLAFDPAYADRAADALGFVREHLWDADEGQLYRRYMDGEVGIAGYLEDYAFLARGALDCYGATGDVDALAFALDLVRVIPERFYDDGTLYVAPSGGEKLVARPQEPTDTSTPSSLGVAIEVLQKLAPFAPNEGFEAITEEVLETHAGRVRGSPVEHPTLALAIDRAARGPLEVTVVAEDASLPDGWREPLGSAHLPDPVFAPRPASETALDGWLDALSLDEAPPIWAGREADDGASLYVCRERACSPPLSDPEAAIEWAADLAP